MADVLCGFCAFAVAPAGTPVPEVEIAPIGSSNLETSYLLDQVRLWSLFESKHLARSADWWALLSAMFYHQVENLRGAVKFLRSENSYLKSADLMRELDALPALSRLAISREVGAGASKDDADGTVEGGKAEKERETEKGKETEKEKEDEREAGRPAVARALRGETSLRAVASEHKALYDQLLRLAAAPKVVDLSFVGKAAVAAPAQAGAEATARGGRGETPSPAQAAVWRRAWQPAARLPERQYRAQKEAAAQLRARVERLAMRVRAQQGADAGGGARSMASYAYGGGRAGRTGAEGRRMPTIPSIA